MLTKRANILFDEELWKTLVNLAKVNSTSVGKLVRDAVEDKYSRKEVLARRKKAFENILKARPKPYHGKINYKELINEGRTVY